MSIYKLLRQISDTVNSAPQEDQCGLLQGFEASLNLLNARATLPHAARWFLESRTVEGKQPDPSDDFWASRVSPEAAQELGELVPRFAVLYGESRQCDLVGNSGARWGYSALALLPEPPDESLQERLLQELFDHVAGLTESYASSPSNICYQALSRNPPESLLLVHYEYENPDVSQGHCMMRLEFPPDEAQLHDDVVSYWPALDDPEFNYIDHEVLSATCERLGLRHVLPLQLATFLTVLANASANHSESWGGKLGVWLFDENILYTVKRCAEDYREESLSPRGNDSDEGHSGKRRIPLLAPPEKSTGPDGLPLVVYVRSDGDKSSVHVWHAENKQEAAEIERFCKAAESFDFDDPSTHVVEF